MNQTVIHSDNADIAESRRDFFDNFIAHLRLSEVLIDTKLANKETEEFFNALATNNYQKAAQLSSIGLHNEITEQIVKLFLNELFTKRKANVIDISFDLSGQDILVWSTIEDDDEKAEIDLYRAESAANAKFQKFHYTISVTVLEKSDNIKAPSQYFSLNKARA